MTQPIPQITERDIKRLITREFPNENYDEVYSILCVYGKESYEKESLRVYADSIKLSEGKLELLKKYIDAAKCDYRDIMSWAEYPTYSKSWSDMKDLSANEQNQIMDSDWQQYQNWFNKN